MFIKLFLAFVLSLTISFGQLNLQPSGGSVGGSVNVTTADEVVCVSSAGVVTQCSAGTSPKITGKGLTLGGVLTTTVPGGTVEVWKLYQLAGVANGVGGCANANGCWSVNAGAAVNQTAGLTQDVVLFALPAKGYVSGMRIKTNVVCTGATSANTGLGTASSNAYYRAFTYDIAAAVSATNKTDVLALTGADTAAGVNIVASLVTTVNNVDAIVDTCVVDYWVKWAVLP